jgi:multidrug resistance efflux pump
VRTVLRLGKEVRAGEILVQLDAEAKRFALDEAKARLVGLRARIQALTLEIQAKKEGIEAHRKESTAALEESGARMVEAKTRARFAEQQLKAREALRHGNLVSDRESQAGAGRGGIRQR